MSAPSVVRIFFAIDLPSSIKDKLNQYIGSMKKKAKWNGIRWTRAENLHLTLQFLAEVKSEHLNNLFNNVRAEIEEIVPRMTFEFSDVELLPNPFRPRVIVLGVKDQNELANLSKLIGHGIQASNYPIEDRPFKAHITLGRIKHPHNAHLEFLTECPVPPLSSIQVNEIVLFRSDPQPDGSKYTILEKIMLR